MKTAYTKIIKEGEYPDMQDPCLNCSEKEHCGGFVCKEALEYLAFKETTRIGEVMPREKAKDITKHWIDNADSYICPVCGFETNNPSKYEGCKCPRCGFQDEKDKQVR